jgi:hypothetical protein
MNIDCISFTATAPGAGPTALAPVAGDPATVRNSVKGALVCIVAGWSKSQLAAGTGFTQVLFPSGHDLVRGLRFINVTNMCENKVPLGFPPQVKPQDPLTVSMSGSATAGDVEYTTLMFFYENLPGVNARLATLAEVRRRGVNALTIYDTITAGGAVTTYQTPRALNAGSDLMKADTEYALMGYQVAIVNHGLFLRGPDTGNMRIGMPGMLDANQSAQWFSTLSENHGLPLIPVINSANRAGTFVEHLQDENNLSVPYALNLVQLAPSSKLAAAASATTKA